MLSVPAKAVAGAVIQEAVADISTTTHLLRFPLRQSMIFPVSVPVAGIGTKSLDPAICLLTPFANAQTAFITCCTFCPALSQLTRRDYLLCWSTAKNRLLKLFTSQPTVWPFTPPSAQHPSGPRSNEALKAGAAILH
ncbi:hypothetical protein BYT27DRAFT_7253314 [Phlegmacium glaucopus]|nr:hypothetical protein BYT27DRAFT_7253314 [Phlegmacium glaucopus]